MNLDKVGCHSLRPYLAENLLYLSIEDTSMRWPPPSSRLITLLGTKESPLMDAKVMGQRLLITAYFITQQAKAYLEKAMKLDPTYLEAVYIMTEILAQQQQFEQGIQLWVAETKLGRVLLWSSASLWNSIYNFMDASVPWQPVCSSCCRLRKVLQTHSTTWLHTRLAEFLTHTNAHQEALDQFSIALR